MRPFIYFSIFPRGFIFIHLSNCVLQLDPSGVRKVKRRANIASSQKGQLDRYNYVYFISVRSECEMFAWNGLSNDLKH